MPAEGGARGETAGGADGVRRFTEDKAGVRMKMRRPRQRRRRRDGRRRRRVMRLLLGKGCIESMGRATMDEDEHEDGSQQVLSVF